jgi:hypothetical protein
MGYNRNSYFSKENFMKPNRSSIFVFALLILSLSIFACVLSAEQAYLEKVNAPIADYNAKFDSLESIMTPNDITNIEWQAKITVALDELDKSAVTLKAATGEAPESCAALDGYLTEIAGSTTELTASHRNLLAAMKEYNDEIKQQTSYMEAMMDATMKYSEKLGATASIFDSSSNTADPAWQSKSEAAIAELEQAGAAMGNISVEVPEPFIPFDQTLKQVAAETKNLAKVLRETTAYLASGKNMEALQKAQEAAALYQRIGEIVQQVKVEDFTNASPREEAYNARLKESEAAASKLNDLIAKANGEINKFNKK